MSNPQQLLECLNKAAEYRNSYIKDITASQNKMYELYKAFPTNESRIIWLCYNMICLYRGAQICEPQAWLYKFKKIEGMRLVNLIKATPPDAENIRKIYIYSLALYCAINTNGNADWLKKFPSEHVPYHADLGISELFLNAFIEGDNNVW